MPAPSAAALQLIPKTNNPSYEMHFPLNVGHLVGFYTRVRHRFSSSDLRGEVKPSFLLSPITPSALQRSDSQPLPPQAARLLISSRCG